MANSAYKQSLDADKYDYISHDQHKEHASVPEISTTQSDQNSQQQYEPRPYEEFRKHEPPVYAEPNKKLKSKKRDKETQNSASHLGLGANSTPIKRISMPPPQESSEYSKLRADLGNSGQNRRSLNLIADDMYSTIDVAPPLPPPMVEDTVPATESSSGAIGGKKLGTGSMVRDDKKTKSSQDLSQERDPPYKNVERLRVCNSSDQLQQKNGADVLYYNAVSRENINNFSGSEGSSTFYDQPPKTDVETSEIHQELYMNV